ncbi:Type 1 glutamine amidotransferase-like domain-containing protein [Bacillus testis]|uniref:Type 1 glutamine amidotransferase-like domain-containing protein n=1 Tax=Bacillus testis TaxID=1622072 RepID=UPI00067EC41A|nr:peptidase E [Bacillus testis]
MKQIITLGGGGFSMEPDNLLLDQYILEQCPKPRPKICFLPTASGDAEGYIDRFFASFAKLDCEPSVLSLFKPPYEDLEAFLLDKDIVYVGGGNTKNLLVLWREWGLDVLLRKAYEKGVVLAGLSAGSLCWFEEGVTDSYGDVYQVISCLGFLKGSHCPHYDGAAGAKKAYRTFVESGEIMEGMAVDDGAGLHFMNGSLHKAISSRPAAKAYYVKAAKENVKEVALNMHYLGGKA